MLCPILFLCETRLLSFSIYYSNPRPLVFESPPQVVIKTLNSKIVLSESNQAMVILLFMFLIQSKICKLKKPKQRLIILNPADVDKRHRIIQTRSKFKHPNNLYNPKMHSEFFPKHIFQCSIICSFAQATERCLLSSRSEKESFQIQFWHEKLSGLCSFFNLKNNI